jgi:hypothetical protein
MNTVRLPRIEPELLNDVIVDIVKDAPALPVQIAANNPLFAVSPFADRPWIASSRRERQATAAAAPFSRSFSMYAVSILPRRALCTALLIVLTACGGGDGSDEVTDPHAGFDPINCSSATIRCA